VFTPFNLQFDFSTFLSLTLALFSVALAAMFYFKATDTSNVFYDNTYKFTQEIASLLVKIESGFGEKLSHLDEAYRGMNERFDKFPRNIQQIEAAKEELEQKEKQLAEIKQDKDNVIDEIATKAHLGEEERNSFKKALEEKDKLLNEARRELEALRQTQASLQAQNAHERIRQAQLEEALKAQIKPIWPGKSMPKWFEK